MVDHPADNCVSRRVEGTFGNMGVIDAEEVAAHTGVLSDESSPELTPLIVPLLVNLLTRYQKVDCI